MTEQTAGPSIAAASLDHVAPLNDLLANLGLSAEDAGAV